MNALDAEITEPPTPFSSHCLDTDQVVALIVTWEHWANVVPGEARYTTELHSHHTLRPFDVAHVNSLVVGCTEHAGVYHSVVGLDATLASVMIQTCPNEAEAAEAPTRNL